jgi:hypothetical protein
LPYLPFTGAAGQRVRARHGPTAGSASAAEAARVPKRPHLLTTFTSPRRPTPAHTGKVKQRAEKDKSAAYVL